MFTSGGNYSVSATRTFVISSSVKTYNVRLN